jgi:hypothetical protein
MSSSQGPLPTQQTTNTSMPLSGLETAILAIQAASDLLHIFLAIHFYPYQDLFRFNYTGTALLVHAVPAPRPASHRRKNLSVYRRLVFSVIVLHLPTPPGHLQICGPKHSASALEKDGNYNCSV